MQTYEQLMAGDYGGLYAEVVTHDVYGLKRMTFEPTLIIDIGANIGIFTRYAHEMFPQAGIEAVEPHQENVDYFNSFRPRTPLIRLHKCALGKGPVYHYKGARNGSGEVYLTPGLGYPEDSIAVPGNVEYTQIMSVTLKKLFKHCVRESDRVLLKIDCEGGENSIWTDDGEMECLARADYVAIELHNHAQNGALLPEVKSATENGLKRLSKTHQIIREHVVVQATRNISRNLYVQN